MDIYERLKLVRNDQGLTQSEMGARLGVSRDVYANLENNRLVKPETKEPLLRLLCKEFNLNEDWFRTGAGGVENMYIPAEAQQYVNIGRAARTPREFREFLSRLIDMLPDEYCDYLYEEFKKFSEEYEKKKGE